MTFDLGGFLGSIIGVIGAYGIAKWQFENSKGATIELEKEMFVRTKAIENVQVSIENSKKIVKFITDVYLNNFSLDNDLDIELIKDIPKNNEEMFHLFNSYTLYVCDFIKYDSMDEYVLNRLEIEEKIEELSSLVKKINLSVLEYYSDDKKDWVKAYEIKNELNKFRTKISSIDYPLNVYKSYNFLRMEKNSSREDVLLLLKEYEDKIKKEI